jgi:hypothetical protein
VAQRFTAAIPATPTAGAMMITTVTYAEADKHRKICVMRSSFKRLRLIALLLSIVSWQPCILLAHTPPERFWLAGRYDRTRIIVYFDAVKFNGTLPTTAKKLVPEAGRFFEAVEISQKFVAPFQNAPSSEHFAIGDQYDLVLEENHVATVSLSTLIGCETDEEVGNDSFIGALATLEENDLPYFRKDYYALRQHHAGRQKPTAEIPDVWAHIENEPVEFSAQSKIVALLTDRMNTLATNVQRQRAEKTSPIFQVQAFRVSDGTLRYYARIFWKPEKDSDRSGFAIGAWLAASPTLHILALEKRTCGYDDFECVVPNLLNVLDLGAATGLVVAAQGDDSIGLVLVEYSDGLDLMHMRTLQSFGTGE